MTKIVWDLQDPPRLRGLVEEIEAKMAKIDEIIASVGEEGSVIASVGVLLDQLTAAIKELKEDADPAKLEELAKAIEANKDLLRAAVVKNTPEEGSVDAHGLTT